MSHILMENILKAIENNDLEFVKNNLHLTNQEMRRKHIDDNTIDEKINDLLCQSVMHGNVAVIDTIFQHALQPGNEDMFYSLDYAMVLLGKHVHYDAIDYMLHALNNAPVNSLLAKNDNHNMNEEQAQQYKSSFVKMLLCKACKKGDWKIINMVLDLYHHIDVSSKEISPLSFAASNQHWDIAKFLLNSDNFLKSANIHTDKSIAITAAIKNNNHDMVQYFLYSKELINNADPHKVLMDAFEKGNTQAVEYMLHSPYVNPHPDFHYQNELIFRKLCLRKKKTMLEYIMNNIGITPAMIKILQTPKFGIQQDFADNLMRVFNNKILYEQLHHDLSSNKKTQPKKKI